MTMFPNNHHRALERKNNYADLLIPASFLVKQTLKISNE